MSAPEGEELYFFIELGESSAMDLTIKTWGGGVTWDCLQKLRNSIGMILKKRPMGRQFGETEYESDWGVQMKKFTSSLLVVELTLRFMQTQRLRIFLSSQPGMN